MARPKKDRSAEVSAVFNGLQYCNATELNEVIEKAKSLLEKAKKAEIEATEKQIAELNAKLAELKK